MINKKIIYVYRFPKNWDERTSKSPIHYFFFFLYYIFFNSFTKIFTYNLVTTFYQNILLVY